MPIGDICPPELCSVSAVEAGAADLGAAINIQYIKDQGFIATAPEPSAALLLATGVGLLLLMTFLIPTHCFGSLLFVLSVLPAKADTIVFDETTNPITVSGSKTGKA
jgi:hypothetical protein